MKYIYRHIKKFQLKFSAMEVYDNWSSPIRLIYYAVSSFTRYMRFYFLCHLLENCSSSILIGNEHANDTFRRKHLKSQLDETVQAKGSLIGSLIEPSTERKTCINSSNWSIFVSFDSSFRFTCSTCSKGSLVDPLFLGGNIIKIRSARRVFKVFLCSTLHSHSTSRFENSCFDSLTNFPPFFSLSCRARFGGRDTWNARWQLTIILLQFAK